MADNQFDDFIRSKMEPYASKVPADMWDRISAGKKKRRIAYWWKNTGLFLLLTGTLTASWILYDNKENGMTTASNPNDFTNVSKNKKTTTEKDFTEQNSNEARVTRKQEIVDAGNNTGGNNSSVDRQNGFANAEKAFSASKGNSEIRETNKRTSTFKKNSTADLASFKSTGNSVGFKKKPAPYPIEETQESSFTNSTLIVAILMSLYCFAHRTSPLLFTLNK